MTQSSSSVARTRATRQSRPEPRNRVRHRRLAWPLAADLAWPRGSGAGLTVGAPRRGPVSARSMKIAQTWSRGMAADVKLCDN